MHEMIRIFAAIIKFAYEAFNKFQSKVFNIMILDFSIKFSNFIIEFAH